MNKLNILHVTAPDKFPTGGPRTIIDLISSLPSSRFNSIIIYPSGEFADKLSKYARVSTHTLKKTPNLKNLLHIFKLLKENKKSIIHIHNSKMLWITPIIRLFKKNKIIYTEHVLTKQYNPPSKILWILFKIRFKLFIHFVHQVICVSEAVKDCLLDIFHLPQNKLTVVTNGISLPRRVVHHSNKSSYNITTIGALNWVKNYNDMINIVELTVKKSKSPTFQLNIIGDGKERKNIENLIKNKKLEKYVNLKGHLLSLDEIHEQLYLSDLYIQTSFTESFGLGILEAMAYGVPVIAYDTGAIPELLDKQTGVLIPFNKNEKVRTKIFADKIVELIQDNKLRNSLGKNGVAKSKNFSIEKTTKKYIEVVESIIS